MFGRIVRNAKCWGLWIIGPPQLPCQNNIEKKYTSAPNAYILPKSAPMSTPTPIRDCVSLMTVITHESYPY